MTINKNHINNGFSITLLTYLKWTNLLKNTNFQKNSKKEKSKYLFGLRN